MKKPDGKEIRRFRAIGHKLKPVVTIADKGLSEGVVAELNRALSAHELIKVKIPAGENADKKLLVDEICKLCEASCVQTIGNVVLLYRAAEKPDPKLSNLRRRLA